MLALYIVLGVFGVETGPIATTIALPAARMVTPVPVPADSAARGLVTGYALVADQAMDPHDRALYGTDWSTLLGAGKLGELLEVSPDAAAVALGVRVIDRGSFRPRIDRANGRTARWLEVDEAFRDNDAFKGDGIDVGVTQRVASNDVPPRIAERTDAVTLRAL